jgi:hypothetical protein
MQGLEIICGRVSTLMNPASAMMNFIHGYFFAA